MTALTLAIDNDIVIKLTQMDVYTDGLSAIGVTPQQAGSTEVMLKFLTAAAHGTKLRLRVVEQDRLKAALHTITDLAMTEPESKIAAAMMKAILQAELDLDEGETTLLAIASQRDGLEVATGDKRALRGLPSLAKAYPGLSILKGRFICLEHIFRKICQIHGFRRAREAVLTATHADTTIFAFYDAVAGHGANFALAMKAVVDELKKDAPGWLKPLS